ncbi:hypothetical protein GSE51_00055, partial [Streptomyces sp. XHT-2]|nr:hypothetical protein [Streptomyces sp. XHT-2]
LGRREEALTAITRAVEIRETLAQQRPEVFTEPLKRSIQLRKLLEEMPEE